MDILNTLTNLRNDMKTWVTNNLVKLKTDLNSHTHNYLYDKGEGSLTPDMSIGCALRYDHIPEANVGSLPYVHGANGVLTAHTYSGNYHHQIGFSSNEQLYHRCLQDVALNTTTPWNKILRTSDFVVTGDTNNATLTINLD